MANRVEPIKSKEDIEAMKQAMMDNDDWRAYQLFVLGINFGLRISDLLTLNFKDIMYVDGHKFKEKFTITESKTNKRKHIVINDSVKDAVTKVINNTFFKNKEKYNTPLFWSKYKTHEPMSRTTAHRIMKKYAKEVGIEENVSTHSLRKSFAYWQFKNSDLPTVMKLLNHSSQKETLRYLGINSPEVDEAYATLNL